MLTKNLADRQTLEKRFKTARTNLLLVVAFTAINIFLVVTKSDTYFLFSAYIPYALAYFGVYFCGMYPKEYYGEDYSSLQFFDTKFFVVLLTIAIVIVALYLLGWIFSKNNKVGWLIFALVFFAIDTLGMFLFVGVQIQSMLDIVFHAWVIVSLTMGIVACDKLKKLPPEEAETLEVEEISEQVAMDIENQ